MMVDEVESDFEEIADEDIVDEDIQEEPDEDIQEEPVEPDPYEEEALKYGWKPQDDWKGDGNPMSAEQWMTRGPGTSRKLADEISSLKSELEETKKNSQRALRATKAAADARIEAELARIKAEKKKAVEVGDIEAYDALEEEEASVSRSESNEQEVVAEWAAKNLWFETDPIMQGAAISLYGEAQKKGITDPAAKLEYVESRIKDELPHKFESEKPKPKPKRKSAPVETSGRAARVAKTGKGWNDIPASDRKEAMEQIEDGDFDHLAEKLKLTAKEAFAKLYFEQ